jgi:hypothetical protein
MTDRRKITYLDTVPVRYNGSTPSMSRRGGVRLHPVNDGVIDMHGASSRVKYYDGHGQKLRDVTNPITGMYDYSVSALESRPNFEVGMDEPASPPVNGNPTGTLKMLPASVRVDARGNRAYLDENGRRIRTTDMGEAPIAAVPRKPDPSTTPKTTKRGRGVKTRAANGRSGGVPGAADGSRITDADVVSYIRAMVRVKTGRTDDFPITANMMRDGREALKLARKKAADYIAGQTVQADQAAQKKA